MLKNKKNQAFVSNNIIGISSLYRCRVWQTDDDVVISYNMSRYIFLVASISLKTFRINMWQSKPKKQEKHICLSELEINKL